MARRFKERFCGVFPCSKTGWDSYFQVERIRYTPKKNTRINTDTAIIWAPLRQSTEDTLGSFYENLVVSK